MKKKTEMKQRVFKYKNVFYFGGIYRPIPNIFCAVSLGSCDSMIEPHRSKISEKDTSGNIMHRAYMIQGYFIVTF